jgi:hypothetical protein
MNRAQSVLDDVLADPLPLPAASLLVEPEVNPAINARIVHIGHDGLEGGPVQTRAAGPSTTSAAAIAGLASSTTAAVAARVDPRRCTGDAFSMTVLSCEGPWLQHRVAGRGNYVDRWGVRPRAGSDGPAFSYDQGGDTP